MYLIYERGVCVGGGGYFSLVVEIVPVMKVLMANLLCVTLLQLKF